MKFIREIIQNRGLERVWAKGLKEFGGNLILPLTNYTILENGMLQNLLSSSGSNDKKP